MASEAVDPVRASPTIHARVGCTLVNVQQMCFTSVARVARDTHADAILTSTFIFTRNVLA